MSETLLADILVPVADDPDARATALALAPYDPDRVTVVHVVEKGDSVPDKTPIEQSESVAADAFATFRESVPHAETETAYGRDVVGTIIDVAAARDASAIAFRPRAGSRLVQFLAGDRALRLVSDADRPVIALPEAAEQ